MKMDDVIFNSIAASNVNKTIVNIDPIFTNNIRKYEIRDERYSWFSLGNGLFVIPYKGLVFIYLVTATESSVHLVTNSLEDIFSRKEVEQFIRRNLPDRNDSSQRECLKSQVSKQTDNSASNNFVTHNIFRLMLSLTTDCNLCCSYCYIRGGAKHFYMPWDLVKNSIDYAIKGGVNNGLKTISLNFHGQGEPTLSWDILCRAVDYHQEQCRKHELDYDISLSTNGLINSQQIRFFKEHNIDTLFSMDTHKKELNFLRPMRNGDELLPHLIETLEKCESIGLDFSIRGTITPVNVRDMKDFVNFLSSFKHCKQVHFEPVAKKGRAYLSKLDDIFYEDYIANFCEARVQGLRQGIDVMHASSQLCSRRKTFCGARAADMNFCVSATGTISSCYEHMDDNEGNSFFYGRYTDGIFCINYDKINELIKAGELKNKCIDCFLSTTCAGGCCADKDERRCYVNREIAKNELFLISLAKIVSCES